MKRRDKLLGQIARQEPWPEVSERLVEHLEKLFPARCIRPTEGIEDHLRYAGRVELIAELRGRLPARGLALALTDDEEEALDEIAVDIAVSTALAKKAGNTESEV